MFCFHQSEDIQFYVLTLLHTDVLRYFIYLSKIYLLQNKLATE